MFSNYEVPSELKINVPFTIQTNKNGETKFSYDVSTKKNSATKTYYVDIKKGTMQTLELKKNRSNQLIELYVMVMLMRSLLTKVCMDGVMGLVVFLKLSHLI